MCPWSQRWKTISLMWLWCRGKMFPSSENIWCSSLLSPIFSLISVTESYRSAMLCGSNGSADMSDQKEFQPLSPYFYMRPRISIRACVCPLVGSSEKCTKGFISPILSLPFNALGLFMTFQCH